MNLMLVIFKHPSCLMGWENSLRKNCILKSHWCPNKAKIFNKSMTTFKRREKTRSITRSRRTVGTVGLFRLQVSVAESGLGQRKVKLLWTFWRWKKILLSLPTLKKAALSALNLSVLRESLEDKASGLTTIIHLCWVWAEYYRKGLQVWLAPTCSG